MSVTDNEEAEHALFVFRCNEIVIEIDEEADYKVVVSCIADERRDAITKDM